MKFVTLVLSALMLIAVTARANDTDTFNAMMVLANKGDAEAQYHVGMMYNNGIGTPQDIRQAFEWFQKSAAHDPLGAYKLGCYYAGQGGTVVARNEEEALKHKLVAAKAGYSLAQFDVALHYAQHGNFDEAVKWLQQAAAQGDDSALYGLSQSYYDGKGVPRDLAFALGYYQLSLMMRQEELNDRNKAVMDHMLAQMSEAEIAKAQELVGKWKPEPTALTLKALNGISAAEEYVRKASD